MVLRNKEGRTVVLGNKGVGCGGMVVYSKGVG